MKVAATTMLNRAVLLTHPPQPDQNMIAAAPMPEIAPMIAVVMPAKLMKTAGMLVIAVAVIRAARNSKAAIAMPVNMIAAVPTLKRAPMIAAAMPAKPMNRAGMHAINGGDQTGARWPIWRAGSLDFQSTKPRNNIARWLIRDESDSISPTNQDQLYRMD